MVLAMRYQKLESFATEEIAQLTHAAENIRNVSVLSTVQNGKYPLAGLLAQGACDRSRDATGLRDGAPGTLAKQVVQSFSVDIESKEQECPIAQRYLLNLVEDPDRPALPQAAALSLRITDGAIVLLDAGLGISAQAEGLLCTALSERNRATIWLDIESLLAQRQSKEDVYQILAAEVHSVNAIIERSGYCFSQERIDPVAGNIAFGSLAHGWAVTLPHFGARYGEKLGLTSEDLAQRLWGDNFFDTETRAWSEEPQHHGRTLKRSFIHFILDPIFKIYDAARSASETVPDVLAVFGIELDAPERELTGDALLQASLQQFLPASNAILQLAVTNLPSPMTAQKYRAEWLYQGSLDDEAGVGIRTCDANGPLIVFITRAIPTPDKDNEVFYLLGRIFSGTVKQDQQVWTDKDAGRFRDGKSITSTNVVSGMAVVPVAHMSAGNIVAIQGKDLPSPGGDETWEGFTMTTSNAVRKCRGLVFNDRAAIFVNIRPEDSKDVPKVGIATRGLARSDPFLLTFADEADGFNVQGFDEMQVQRGAEQLQKFLNETPIRISKPLFRYREGIKTPSEETCLTKSPNKRCRLYSKATPLPENLTREIESGLIDTEYKSDQQAAYLAKHHSPDWTLEKARKIWSFAPHGSGPNILVDSTVAVQYVTEFRDSLVSGFQWAAREGPLCEEPLRGVRVDIVDAWAMCDARFRGRGQLIPTMRRAVYGTVLRASPFLFEAVYLVEVYVARECGDSLRGIIAERKGVVIREESTPAGLTVVQAYVRAEQALGLTQLVTSTTGGSADHRIWFDHWEELQGDLAATFYDSR
ncbi:hypothetical protein BJY01DRAFT_262471 [Aspergillus pseudoustus]|uniref:Elongation factor 2 n=1 Tax=Aspergillus pseudoustus TaxID=1810923 RepID=A0ABR4IE55_9EURO